MDQGTGRPEQGRNSTVRAAIAAIVLAAFSAPAAAIPLLDIVTTADSIAGSLPNDGRHDIAETEGASGWYNANLVALEDVYLEFTFLGMEAGWTDTLSVNGSTLFTNQTSSPGDSAYGGTADAGNYIDFLLSVISGGNAGLAVANGANNPPTGTIGILPYGEPNFWLGYADAEHTMVYIGFDDGGGDWNGDIDDDDHDDLVAKITAVHRVPEPATLSLLGASLMLFGFAGRRRI